MLMIVIIGNGIAGVTVARNIRKSSDEAITIISSESKYFFSRTALMYVYMGHMKFEHTQPYEPHFWGKNRIDLEHEHVSQINKEEKTVSTDSGKTISYDKLIIASGSKPNKFGWPGQDANGVRGMYSKQDLEYIERYSEDLKTAVIVGGGLIGIEMAEMFLSRNIEVHFLVRENLFWSSVLPEQDAKLIMNHFEKHHGLHMHYSKELDTINTDKNNNAISVLTKNGETIPCQFVGLTAGVSPNIEFVKSSGIETNRGILINTYFETSIKDVYAIGDCAEFKHPIGGRRPLEQVWYTGKIMGENLAKTITGNKTEYNPGNWFNSAKFFEIEYQTYGVVQNKLQENEAEFVYHNREKELLLHFVFDKNSKKFIGINNFGIRMRHPVFNNWLLEGASIEDVLADLKTANFDPEFYSNYEDEIIAQYNTQFNANIQVNKAKWWQKLINA
ncbi:MAG: FAD-dependent oxidoreductase [Crocinitomicaceae bacterium]|nr:FAD-dependent oxidoreductase [Crocinitomicaceae bacterium]